MTEAAMVHHLQVLTSAVLQLVNTTGHRISRAELLARQGIHRNTLLRRLQQDSNFPRPGPDGKWALSDVVAWELKNPTKN